MKPRGQSGVGVWKDEKHIEELKVLWAKGLSASQIVGKLTFYTTRNAVIGKMHRLGLSPNNLPSSSRISRKPRKPNSKKTPRVDHTAPREGPPKFRAEIERSTFVELVIPPEKRKQLVDLEANECHWPIGDPQEADFHFCGHPRVPGVPYCLYHAKAAYVPVVKVRRRSPARLVAEHVQHAHAQRAEGETV